MRKICHIGRGKDAPPSEASITKRIKAYSYLRFSTPEQMQGDSQRRQFDAALNYDARRASNWTNS